MKLYQVETTLQDKIFYEYASSDSNASKVRTKLKKVGHNVVGTPAHEVETTREGLIKYLNSQFAAKY